MNEFELAGCSPEESKELMDMCDRYGIPYDSVISAWQLCNAMLYETAEDGKHAILSLETLQDD